MQKIYIVEAWSGMDHNIIAVFSTRERADRYIQDREENGNTILEYGVEEFEINKPS